jgi:hypothetical protein
VLALVQEQVLALVQQQLEQMLQKFAQRLDSSS